MFPQVFTTGTIDTQKKYGRRVNYFPIKAAQCFNTTTMRLTNGIFIGACLNQPMSTLNSPL
jgi:hypothetical protein